MVSTTVLIYRKHLVVSDQSGSRSIIARQISTEDKWRAKYAPKRHQCLLLAGSQLCRRSSAFFRRDAQSSERKHVRIRPCVVLSQKLRPVPRVIELLLEQFPIVPKVVGDAPHLRILLKKLHFRNRRRTRRDAEHDGPADLANRQRKCFDLRRLIKMTPHVIGLDEIHTPRRIQLRE